MFHFFKCCASLENDIKRVAKLARKAKTACVLALLRRVEQNLDGLGIARVRSALVLLVVATRNCVLEGQRRRGPRAFGQSLGYYCFVTVCVIGGVIIE